MLLSLQVCYLTCHLDIWSGWQFYIDAITMVIKSIVRLSIQAAYLDLLHQLTTAWCQSCRLMVLYHHAIMKVDNSTPTTATGYIKTDGYSNIFSLFLPYESWISQTPRIVALAFSGKRIINGFCAFAVASTHRIDTSYQRLIPQISLRM